MHIIINKSTTHFDSFTWNLFHSFRFECGLWIALLLANGFRYVCIYVFERCCMNGNGNAWKTKTISKHDEHTQWTLNTRCDEIIILFCNLWWNVAYWRFYSGLICDFANQVANMQRRMKFEISNCTHFFFCINLTVGYPFIYPMRHLFGESFEIKGFELFRNENPFLTFLLQNKVIFPCSFSRIFII